MADLATFKTCIMFSTTAISALAFNPNVHAGVGPCRCEPSIAVYSSPFYGYYRTCWRPWPGGQPPCPCYPIPTTTEQPAPRAGTSERTIELLPLPRPEEPEGNEAK
jgi:hypothetical protein